MDKPLHIDHERRTATVPLITDSPMVLVINKGNARIFEIADYGEFHLKTHDGNVTVLKLSESVKW